MNREAHANGVITYTFESLTDHPVNAHISTRHGGVSPAPWSSLNMSIARGDSRERVEENRERLTAAIGVVSSKLVRCRQVHGTGVAKVDMSDADSWLDGTDGLVTDTPALPLLLLFADCTPILLYDPEHHALGVCHAGWRGTVNGMAAATLWMMQAAYDTQPANVIACIGPSIGPESYEVGDDVWSMAHAKLNGPERFFTFPNGPAAKPYFNLWAANAAQLMEGGVLSTNIEISGIDTAKATVDFFSHRAEQGRCGLFTMIAWLTPPTV
ncbi:MAG TPA: peptidoglycan editing factor PgeF [Caldilineaceae bacterium]|nr:peptidoglycan editing factor PgeF [Caldilineaceae bacterium]